MTTTANNTNARRLDVCFCGEVHPVISYHDVATAHGRTDAWVCCACNRKEDRRIEEAQYTALYLNDDEDE